VDSTPSFFLHPIETYPPRCALFDVIADTAVPERFNLSSPFPAGETGLIDSLLAEERFRAALSSPLLFLSFRLTRGVGWLTPT